MTDSGGTQLNPVQDQRDSKPPLPWRVIDARIVGYRQVNSGRECSGLAKLQTVFKVEVHTPSGTQYCHRRFRCFQAADLALRGTIQTPDRISSLPALPKAWAAKNSSAVVHRRMKLLNSWLLQAITMSNAEAIDGVNAPHARLRSLLDPAYVSGGDNESYADSGDEEADAEQIRLKLTKFLNTIPIGKPGAKESTSDRMFDVQPMVNFALEHRHDSSRLAGADVSAEDIYGMFVEWQVENGERQFAQASSTANQSSTKDDHLCRDNMLPSRMVQPEAATKCKQSTTLQVDLDKAVQNTSNEQTQQLGKVRQYDVTVPDGATAGTILRIDIPDITIKDLTSRSYHKLYWATLLTCAVVGVLLLLLVVIASLWQFGYFPVEYEQYMTPRWRLCSGPLDVVEKNPSERWYVKPSDCCHSFAYVQKSECAIHGLPCRRATYAMSRRLYREQTRYQTIEVYKSEEMGTVLVLDGALQLSERFQSNYHEMMGHLPINLVLGSGSQEIGDRATVDIVSMGTVSADAGRTKVSTSMPARRSRRRKKRRPVNSASEPSSISFDESSWWSKSSLRVLILGGGDGGVLHQLLQHPSTDIHSVTMVEIDPAVTDTARRFFPHFAPDKNVTTLNQIDDTIDPTEKTTSTRVNIVNMDATRWVRESSYELHKLRASGATDDQLHMRQYDLVIIDSTDFSLGGAWSAGVHVALKSLLRDEFSAVVCNLDTPYISTQHVTPAVQLMEPLYTYVNPYLVAQPEFATGQYAFLFCSDGVDPLGKVDWSRWDAKDIDTNYYNRGVHEGSLALPQFFKLAVERARRNPLPFMDSVNAKVDMQRLQNSAQANSPDGAASDEVIREDQDFFFAFGLGAFSPSKHVHGDL